MFNIFRRKAHRRISEQEVDTISDVLTQSMIAEMENYDVVFHDQWPPLRVPATRILNDLKNAGYHLPTLIRELNGTYYNHDNRLPVVKLERRIDND